MKVNGQNEYVPSKGEIVTIDFEPSAGREKKKRRPAVVISNQKYSQLTGLAVVTPITSSKNPKMIDLGIYIKVNHPKVDGYVNPLQFHTFDYKRRNIKAIGQLQNHSMKKVLELINQIINGKEQK